MTIKQESKTSKNSSTKNYIREFFDTGIKVLLTAILLKWLLFEAFTMPTSEMESTLLSGDFILISKLHYGARTPATPLQIPLTHQEIGDIPTYLDWIQLPIFRLPAFSEVSQNDIITFNYPPDEHHPIDQKTPFIGRCVGLAGDKFELRQSAIFINGKKLNEPSSVQNPYLIILKSYKTKEDLKELGIENYVFFQDKVIVHLTKEKLTKLNQAKLCHKIMPMVEPPESTVQSEKIFPHSHYFNWNADNFGAIKIPEQGMTIELTPKNLALYESIILKYEGNQEAEIRNDSLFLAHQFVEKYTFEQNYYFVMADNRRNAPDSRFWGFVPENHIIGKAVYTWFSLHPETGEFRFDRIGAIQ